MSVEMVEIIDKRDNTIKKVSKDYVIEYEGDSYTIKDLETEELKIFCIILKIEETDLLYKTRN